MALYSRPVLLPASSEANRALAWRQAERTTHLSCGGTESTLSTMQATIFFPKAKSASRAMGG